MLIAINVYLIIYYKNHPDSINDIILLFWIQSVLIGVFNILDMLTLKKYFHAAPKPTAAPNPDTDPEMRGCMPWFFGMHFGLFHLVYLFFLTNLKPRS